MENTMAFVSSKIQSMVNAGECTAFGDKILWHGKTGAFIVGTEDDLSAVWNVISAYKNAGK